MKIVERGFSLLYPLADGEWAREIKLIETAGRTAYKSEDKITETSAETFVRKIVKRNHLAVIEFGSMAVRFITDRGISHELVRHRLCSFVQESTRYCNYGGDKFGNEITFIKPSGLDGAQSGQWEASCKNAEEAYLKALESGMTPEQARAVLPSSVKAEIVVKANFREWRHIFRLRAIEKTAHPDMRALMIPLYQKCRSICPEIFDMGEPE